MTKDDNFIQTGTIGDRFELVAALRNDFEAFFEKVFNELNPNSTYKSNWHVGAMIYQLEQCRRGRLRYLAITIPPRNLKSSMVSVALPAFLLGHNPSAKIACVSYGHHLAVDFSNKTRKILKAPWYQELFPNTKIGFSETQTYFDTTEGGYRFATTLGGAFTGVGADYIILDDPQQTSDMMYESSRNEGKVQMDDTVYSRFDHPKTGVMIAVMQRLGDDDLINHFMKAGGWEVIKIPAKAEEDLEYQLSDGSVYQFRKGEFLQPERFGQTEFDDRLNRMGTANFYAQYQQAPVPPAGNMFNWKWFKPAPSRPQYSEVIMSLDVASTKNGGNYSAFTIWGHRDDRWYLRASHRYQYELPEVRQRLTQLDKQYRPDLVIVDGVGVGRGIFQELRREGFKHIVATEGAGKLVDAEIVAPMIEGGRVFYEPDAPGLAEFRNELVAFPKGQYDDQVDSMVQVLKRTSAVLRMARRYKRPERQDIHSENSRPFATVSSLLANGRIARY